MASIPSVQYAALQPVTYTQKYEAKPVRAVVQLEQGKYLLTRYDIEFNAHGATDEAEVTMPISSNPDFSVMFQRNEQNADLPVYVVIYAGFPGNPSPGSTDVSGLSQRFFGIVDIYSARFAENTVTFRCKSLAAPLVAFPVTGLAMAQTSAQLIQEQAGLLGLRTNIQLANPPVTVQQVFASEFIGGQNFAASIANVKAWDLFIKCAMFDDADVWVTNDVLNYCSPGLIDRNTISLVYGTDLVSLDVDHSIQYAKNIRVEVHSYQKRIRQATTHRIETNPFGGIIETPSVKTVTSSPVFGTAEQVSTSTSPTGIVSTTTSTLSGGARTATTSPGSESAKEIYVYYIPNLTPQMCQQVARAIWRQISMLEYRVTAVIPMTVDLLKNFDITMLLNITGSPYKNANSVFVGTNTAMATTQNGSTATSNTVQGPNTDTRYWPRRITETFDPKDKNGWSIRAETVSHTLPAGAV
jgi:hypothetical protein